jgi:hypothetical protein
MHVARAQLLFPHCMVKKRFFQVLPPVLKISTPQKKLARLGEQLHFPNLNSIPFDF